MKKTKPAVFLDRDGTISNEVGYVNHITRFSLIPRVAEAIKLLNETGLLTVVVTNQAGVARGYFPEPLVHEVHEKMKSLLSEKGAAVDGIYYCPHHPDVGDEKYRRKCNCRKPRTGMLEKAEQDLNIDLKNSYMVGDKISDVEFGQKAGAKGILVKTGYGMGEIAYHRESWTVTPDFIAEDLYEAVCWIVKSSSQ